MVPTRCSFIPAWPPHPGNLDPRAMCIRQLRFWFSRRLVCVPFVEAPITHGNWRVSIVPSFRQETGTAHRRRRNFPRKTPPRSASSSVCQAPKQIIRRNRKLRWLRKLLILWSGLSESHRHLNLGNSKASGKSGTYEALSGALSSFRSRQKRLMILQLVPHGMRHPSSKPRTGS
jgi:hypothetical protein